MREILMVGDPAVPSSVFDREIDFFKKTIAVLLSESNIKYFVIGNLKSLCVDEETYKNLLEYFPNFNDGYSDPDEEIPEKFKLIYWGYLIDIFKKEAPDYLREKQEKYTDIMSVVCRLTPDDKLIYLSRETGSISDTSVGTLLRGLKKRGYMTCQLSIVSIGTVVQHIRFMPGKRRPVWEMTKHEQIAVYGRYFREYVDKEFSHSDIATDIFRYVGSSKWLGIFMGVDGIKYFHGIGTDVVGCIRAFTGLTVKRYRESPKEDYKTYAIDTTELFNNLKGSNSNAWCVRVMQDKLPELLRHLNREEFLSYVTGNISLTLTAAQAVLALDYAKCYDVVIFYEKPQLECVENISTITKFIKEDLSTSFSFNVTDCYLYE